MSKEPKRKPFTALSITPMAPQEERPAPSPQPDQDQPEEAAPPIATIHDPVFDNLAGVKDKDYVDLNFKVKLTLRTEFKQVAAAFNMSNKELMEASYRAFLEKYGKSPRDAARIARETEARSKPKDTDQG